MSGGDDDDWIIALDDANLDTLRGGPGRDNFWRDVGVNGSDINLDFEASDADHGVRQFVNPGAGRTLNGDRIPGPAAPAELTIGSFANNPLFPAVGPSGTDINQGQVSDCKVVSGLSALARGNRAGANWAIRRAMVDFGDGTYGLHLGPNFYRVDALLPLKRDHPSVPHYANLGPEGSIWVSVAEKGIALASPRTPGFPQYADLSSIGADTVFTLFESAQAGTPFIQSYASFTALQQDLAQRFTGPNPQYLTISLSDSVPAGLGRRYVVNHAYRVWDMTSDAAGNPDDLIIRNPWGSDHGIFQRTYSDENPNDGLIVLSVAALFNSIGGRLNWGTRVP